MTKKGVRIAYGGEKVEKGVTMGRVRLLLVSHARGSKPTHADKTSRMQVHSHISKASRTHLRMQE